jgi:hypothetical protein
MTLLVCQVVNSQNLTPIKVLFVLLKEICYMCKNNKTNTAFDMFKIWYPLRFWDIWKPTRVWIKDSKGNARYFPKDKNLLAKFNLSFCLILFYCCSETFVKSIIALKKDYGHIMYIFPTYKVIFYLLIFISFQNVSEWSLSQEKSLFHSCFPNKTEAHSCKLQFY